ncbi:MAG: TIR domain-containing protein [Lachnospiraceae bacterium]|nr:TIR domain-containing protein [Lachnospiraceae bacterium]
MMRQVFYSFHYGNDVMRVQQIRNIGQIEDNKPVSANQWESLRRTGDDAIKNWIDENMKYRSCVVVLIGEETATRKWVKYEIQHAWETGKALMGIYIHNLKDPRKGICAKGRNPFNGFKVGNTNMADLVPCYEPDPRDAYYDIRSNLETWIEEAIKNKRN